MYNKKKHNISQNYWFYCIGKCKKKKKKKKKKTYQSQTFES